MGYARPRVADRYAQAIVTIDELMFSEQDETKLALFDFLIQQCWIALDLCKVEYDPNNVGMEWDAINMVNDRHPGSLSGVLGEIALMLDPKFDAYGIPSPVLDKHRQVNLGLDFITGDKSHQVKSGIVSLTGGAIEVTPALFKTTADYVHILTRWGGAAIRYSASTLIWTLMVATEVARYDGEKQPKQFTLDREDMLRVGVVEHITYDWATT